MRDKIQKLENESVALEPTPAQKSEWDGQLLQYSSDFINNIESLKAYQETRHKGREIIETPFPERGKPLETILEMIHRNVDTPGLNPASGGHLGYIPGGGIYPTAMGDYLAAVTNRYASVFYASPGAVRIEHALIRWMCAMVGFPGHALGNLTSGGSIANLIAFVTARDAKGIRSHDVPRAVIYLSAQVHHCVQKAIRIGGMAESVIHTIPMNERYQMDAAALEAQVEKDTTEGLKPFLIVASAGTTDTGAIDPLSGIAKIAKVYDLWFHVDAAYGGFFMMVPQLKDKFKGIEQSDSVAIDPHKGLFLSYGLGAVLIKDVQAQYESHYYRAAYMQDTLGENEELNPADLSPELSKHFRGMRMWLPLQLLGTAPFVAALKEKYWLCQYFYKKIQELGFEVGPEPELSVCIFRYVPTTGDANDFNEQLVAYVRREGSVFISSTHIGQVFWIRMAVLSFRTHLHTIDKCLEVLHSGVKKWFE